MKMVFTLMEVMMNNQRLTTVIKDRALEKLDNFEDCTDELKYLAFLDEIAYNEVAERYLVIKHTTGYAKNSFRHKLKIFLRTLVG